MRQDIVILGDELTASAYRLAGFAVVICDPAHTAAELDALENKAAGLVLLASTHASALGLPELTRRMRRSVPPLMVLSDAKGATPLPDFAGLIRRRLGVAK